MDIRKGLGSQRLKHVVPLVIVATVGGAALALVLVAARSIWVLYAATESGRHYIRLHGPPPLISVLSIEGVPTLTIETTLAALAVT
jgi:hypothetical protein